MKEFKSKPLVGLNDLSDDKFSIKTLSRIDSILNNRSKKACSNGGKKGGPKAGKIAKENKLGFHSMEKKDRIEISKKVGKIIGPRSKKEKFGIFGLSKEEIIKNAKIGGKASVNSNNHVNNKRLECPHCGKEGGYTAMKRHHMDRCKHKK